MSEDVIYYDHDANPGCLHHKRVGVIGYGIQGRAQALNLRDSGIETMVANRDDQYADVARQDGFHVHDIVEVAKHSDILFLLIPDQAQKTVYESCITSSFQPGGLLIFAHGYALRFGDIVPDGRFDVGLLAPRMPGRQIRDYYLKGSGVPAFVDVVHDQSGQTLSLLLALGHAIGFSRAGLLRVNYQVETELDLFVEQYIVPIIVKAIRTSFDVLTRDHGYPALPTLIELYASGEVGEVLMRAAATGIGRVFQENASPTCQFGISESYARVLADDQETIISDVIDRQKNGEFADSLQVEGDDDYKGVQEFWSRVNSRELMDAQEKVNAFVRHSSES